MIKPNIEYLAFDDRKFTFFGILILALLVPFLFFGVSIEYYWKVAHQEYFEGLTYTTAYWLLNRFLIIYLREKYGIFESVWKRLGIHFLIVITLVPIASVILSSVIDFIIAALGRQDLNEPTFLQGILSTYFLSFTIIVFYEAIYFFHKYKEAIVEKEKIEKAHIQGQLDNLRNQINPHFLFNSLNTLMNLIPTDSDRAMNYLSKLSKFYRYTVSNQEETLVPLNKEMENVRIYADLLQERFHNGIKINVPEVTSTDLQILPLCLQLLIENAVKHNIVSRKNPLTVDIDIGEDGKYIRVKNNVQKKIQAVSSTGMGLKNIRNRVAYFTKDPLEIQQDDTCFSVSVPLIKSNAQA